MLAELLLGFRWVLGVVFITAGALKVRAAEPFAQTVASYGLVPVFLHRPVARSLPILEIGLGGACLLGVLPAVAGGAACGLLLGFACAVAWNLLQGRQFDCGCGTRHQTTISWGLVLRDIGLAVLAAAIALGPSGSLVLWRGPAALPDHTPAMPDLIPVPMLVILLLAASRLVSASPSTWGQLRRRRRLADDPSSGLSIVRVNAGFSAAERR